MNAEDPAVQGWQAAIELDESRLSTSARARRQSGEMARAQHRLSEALSACSDLGMAYARVVLDNSRLRRENAELRDRLAPVGAPYRCSVCREWFTTGHALRAHRHDPALPDSTTQHHTGVDEGGDRP